MTPDNTAIAQILGRESASFTSEWLRAVDDAQPSGVSGGHLAKTEADGIWLALCGGLQADAPLDRFDDPAWATLRDTLATLSGQRAAQGSSAGDTARFVLAIKRPLMRGLQREVTADPARLFDLIWIVSTLADQMAQWTSTTFQKSREDVIRRQQEELLELSTPVIKLWDGVLAVPMIGTLDSNRTQLVMESLLTRIVETGSELAIIDITGVPTVDTLVAQHLLKTVTAIRLMGADCIISGIRPQIAQTIVHLGIDLQGVVTKATLADALRVAFAKAGYTVVRDKR